MPDPIERLRSLCLALPGTSEKLSHGEAAFFAGRTPTSSKMFVMVDEHHQGAARVAFWCAAPEGAQGEMIDEDPSRFFRPPYVGPKGWLGVYIDDGADWGEVEAIVREAFRCVVPASLAEQVGG